MFILGAEGKFGWRFSRAASCGLALNHVLICTLNRVRLAIYSINSTSRTFQVRIMVHLERFAQV